MKDKHDPKFPILPSTTRQGTALSSKAAFDSPTVMNKIVTPPPHTSHVASAGSDTVSDEFDDAFAVLDESGSLCPFLNAMVAKSKKIESDGNEAAIQYNLLPPNRWANGCG